MKIHAAVFVTVLAPALGLASALAAEGTPHPRLVDVATTRCVDCHDDLWPQGAALHAPAEDDCTICHDMSILESGTEVSFIEEGTALCLICHDEFTTAAEGDLEAPHFPVVDACTNCHNPHASPRERLLAAPLGELCAVCHDAADLADPHGGQLTGATDCRRCHDPHGSGNPSMLVASQVHAPFSEGSCKGCHRPPFGERMRLRSRGEKLCTACHGALAPDAMSGTASVHAALVGERGRAGCLSCHDPHMSPNRRLLIAPGPELCGTCHAAQTTAASADGGHAAADDCTNCHLPHSSEETPLLNEPAGELCTQCHDADDESLAATHLGAELEGLVCTSCHDPHGSEHGKLLARHLHGALEAGCDACHDETSDRFLAEGSELCLECHDDPAAGFSEPHFALELGVCADCHNPHAAAQEHLVKLPGGGPCVQCHDEQAPIDGETEHGAIALLGCQACHEPHGGERPRLLRADADELCLGCHDPRRLAVDGDAETALALGHFAIPADRVERMTTLRLSADGQKNHPNVGHRVLGKPTREELKKVETTFEGELSCLSCHDPHKGRSSLLLWNAASPLAACINCHPK